MMDAKRIEDFSLFQAHEIKVREGAGYTRNGQRKKTLLLYQDARAAMNRLDERFGEYGWQREHKDVHGVAYCGVSLWDDDKQCWVTKWDAGERSKTSGEKGEASDSFKRACVNWGIGRELYTAPFIGVDESVDTNGLRVTEIAYTPDRKICALTIADRQGNIIYQFGKKNAANAKQTQQASVAPAPAQEQKPKPTQEELDDIYNSLSEREMAEYNDACRQMQGANERKQIVNIYNRFIDATFAPLLLDYGNKIIKEKGL